MHVRERPAQYGSSWRRLAVGMFVALAAAVGLQVGVTPSSGAWECVRSVDATEAADAAAAETALMAAFADAADGVAVDGCTSWRVEFTGTFELTETVVWDVDVPLTVTGPQGSTARLEAVSSAGPAR